ncbi:hypothetical protein BpHYR1_035755 [Brachionus plicatilis]|uniref:Uncharacterized protein n=1 Tax=Brachionus plicatilis TaxID=10195 RepID=A0A3M7SSY3_BRAPC|nr:hypothetical protein BpHYR1_035755 [Brachionus plicatilis]
MKKINSKIDFYRDIELILKYVQEKPIASCIVCSLCGNLLPDISACLSHIFDDAMMSIGCCCCFSTISFRKSFSIAVPNGRVFFSAHMSLTC